MKKLLLAISLSLIGVFFGACGKIPFEKREVSANLALVYVYVAADVGVNVTNRISRYGVAIDSTNVKGDIGEGEYKFYNVKPGKLSVSASRAEIEKQEILLSLEAGKTYFLRIRSHSDDFAKFEIANVNSREAYLELKDSTLAGSYAKVQTVVSKIVEDQKKESVVVKKIVTSSKTTQLKDAYELKKQGAISDEEFNQLKSEILAR